MYLNPLTNKMRIVKIFVLNGGFIYFTLIYKFGTKI